jgi:hypothetical protein
VDLLAPRSTAEKKFRTPPTILPLTVGGGSDMETKRAHRSTVNLEAADGRLKRDSGPPPNRSTFNDGGGGGGSDMGGFSRRAPS